MQSQLELEIQKEKENDRNLHLGGRSFYFFDFDDNVAFLSTPIVIFHKETKLELLISSREWAKEHSNVGHVGPYIDYEINWDDEAGSFRAFRDHNTAELQKLNSKEQIFIQDVAAALGKPDFHWKGPSWSCFYHATFNQRPISVITARGHSPETLKKGIEQFKNFKFLPMTPNYLSLFPVSHKPTRAMLGDSTFSKSVAELKQAAIRASVMMAIQTYGYSPHHRFGMSDDDPKNIQLITEEMKRIKTTFPEMSFFMIETQDGSFVKHEIGLTHDTATKLNPPVSQLPLF